MKNSLQMKQCCDKIFLC